MEKKDEMFHIHLRSHVFQADLRLYTSSTLAWLTIKFLMLKIQSGPIQAGPIRDPIRTNPSKSNNYWPYSIFIFILRYIWDEEKKGRVLRTSLQAEMIQRTGSDPGRIRWWGSVEYLGS